MKKIILGIIFICTVSFAFATNDVEKISTLNLEETLVITNSIELEKVNFINFSLKLTELSTNVEIVEWVCCTVSTSDSEVTVCRSDGNVGKACRQARKFLQQE